MEIFWGVLFGLLAAVVLVWMVGRVIEAGRAWKTPEFTSSEPERTHEDLDAHLQEWDRSREENDPR